MHIFNILHFDDRTQAVELLRQMEAPFLVVWEMSIYFPEGLNQTALPLECIRIHFLKPYPVDYL